MKDLLQYLRQKKPSTTTLKKWRNWAFRLLRRRHYQIEPSICAYDKTHLVGKVQSFGGGSIFWSLACDGCQLGGQIIHHHTTYGSSVTQTHCALLHSGLLTQAKVKPGDLYHLPAR